MEPEVADPRQSVEAEQRLVTLVRHRSDSPPCVRQPLLQVGADVQLASACASGTERLSIRSGCVHSATHLALVSREIHSLVDGGGPGAEPLLRPEGVDLLVR
jgi:hypothetical protein